MDDPVPSELTRNALIEKLSSISFPTLGHFLEDGFVDFGMRSLLTNIKMIGNVVTLKLADADAVAVAFAVSRLTPGDVLVIDLQGDHAHAPVGAVTATAAAQAGAAGIVIDGVATDVHELRAIGLPVFSRGTSLLTTKLRGTGTSRFNEPVACGQVEVKPGMLALGDDNGLLFADTATLIDVIDKALASDQAEPALLEKIKSGRAYASILDLTPAHVYD